MKRSIGALCLFGALVFISGTVFAQNVVTVYALRGSSGVGMIRLFDTPPQVEGTAIRVEALASPDLMAAKFLSGEARVGILPPNVAAKLASSGRPVRVAAVVGTGMLSLLSTNPAVRSLDDLKGRTVEVAGQGATPDYVFRRILIRRGLNPDRDLKLGYALAYPEIAQALIAGRIELALLPEPFATMARLGTASLVEVADIQAEWAAAGGSALYPMTVLVVDASFAEKSPAALRSIMEAYRESIAWVLANPAAAGALVEKHDLGLKASVAAAAIPKSSYAFIPAVEARPALEALYRAFLEYAPVSIGGKMPADSFYMAVPGAR